MKDTTTKNEKVIPEIMVDGKPRKVTETNQDLWKQTFKGVGAFAELNFRAIVWTGKGIMKLSNVAWKSFEKSYATKQKNKKTYYKEKKW